MQKKTKKKTKKKAVEEIKKKADKLVNTKVKIFKENEYTEESR